MKRWYVYILKCSDGTLYTGCTDDLSKRIQKHNSGKGAKYTRSRLPVTIVFSEPHETQSLALKREIAIKKIDREKKLKLICNINL